MLVGALATLGVIALLALLYIYVLPQGGSAAEKTAEEELEQPAAATPAASPGAHPLAKHLELTGVRIGESSGGRVRIQFLVVNHSGASLPELDLGVTILSSGREFFDFPVKLNSLGPYESKDMSVSVRSTLKPYEMPDWQLVRPQFVITSEK